MASFVEQATLQVRDQSTAQINKINQALKQLQATARSLKSMKVDVTGLSKASAETKRLTADLNRLKASTINLRINTSSIATAQRQIEHLRTSAGRPVSVAAAHAARTPLGGGGGSLVGSTAGAVIGLYAVGSAAQLAAQALRSIADNAAKRDRTTLQSNVAASAAQRKVFADLDKQHGDKRPGPLEMTKDEFDRLRTSLLGDVPSEGNTPEEREQSRARYADMAARRVATDIMPRLFALDPTKTHEETMQGARAILKAINMSTTELFDKNGKWTADAERVIEGIQLAQAATGGTISAETIKTVMANAKTTATTLSAKEIAILLASADDRGITVANQLHQAIKGLSGTKDVEHLNANLRKLGLLEGGTPKPGKKGERGAMVPGSMRPKDQKLLNENPTAWLLKDYKPILDAENKKTAEARAAQARREGKSEAEIAEAGRVTSSDTVAQVAKDFAGMRETALNSITQTMLGFDQISSNFEQAMTSTNQQIGDAILKSWTAQFDRVTTAATDAFAGLGDKIAKSINLDQILKTVADSIIKNPGLTMGISTAVGGAVTLGLGAAAINAMYPFAGAAGALTESAGALTSAAAALSRAGGSNIPGTPGTQQGGPEGNKPTKVEPKTKPDTRFERVGQGSRITPGRAAGAAGVLYLLWEYLKDHPPEKTPEGQTAYGDLVKALKNERDDSLGRPRETERPERDKVDAALEETKRQLAKLNALDKAQQERGRMPGVPYIEPGDLASRQSELTKAINGLTAQVTSLAIKAGEVTPPDWLASLKPDSFPTQPKEGEDKWSGATSVADVKAAAESMSASTATWVSSVANIPSTFEQAFGTLPPKAGEAGTNLGTQANSIIRGGAADAGSAYGNAAAAAIRAAVSNLSINVNANVTGAKNSSSDKGGSQPD